MDGDPFNWTNAEVLQFFSQNAIRFMADRPGGQLPQMATFLQALTAKEVDGASLLDFVDSAVLRDDLGVTNIRQRHTVQWCIQKLQNMSPAHMSLVGSLRPQTPASLVATPHPGPAIGIPANVLATTETAGGAEAVGENVRPGEMQVQDEHGRKRRKIDLSKHQNDVPTISVPVAKPIKKLDTTAYIPDTAVSVDELFFGSTALGNEVKELAPQGNILVDHYDPDTADDNFQFTAQGKQPGAAGFVHSRMQYFLRAEGFGLRRRGMEAVAILPYPETSQSKARSALVVQAGKNDEYIATRERASLLDSGYDFSSVEQQSNGEWDFLLQRHQQGKDDLVLPTFGLASVDMASGSSQSENSDDGDEDAAEEEIDEALLQQSRISKVVDDTVLAHAAKWKEVKLPRFEEKRAWTVWKQTRRSTTIRDTLVTGAQANIDKLNRRLDKLKLELVEREWTSESAVSKVCGNLEPTVEDLEEQKWKISVWQRRKEPPHIIQHKQGAQHSLHTPATGKAATSFAIHPDDRLSVSPTPAEGLGTSASENDEEKFHTPNGTPEPNGFEASDEMSLDLNQAHDDDDDLIASSHYEQPSDGIASSPNAQFSDHISSSPPQHPSAVASAEVETNPTLHNGANNSSSDDLPELDDFMPRKFKNQKQPATPARARKSGSLAEPIEIPSSDSAEQPPLSSRSKGSAKGRGKGKATPKKAKSTFHGRPEETMAKDVDEWEYHELAAQSEKSRLVIKLLRDAGPVMRALLHDCYNKLPRKGFLFQMRAAITTRMTGDAKASGLNEEFGDALLSAANIGVAWYACRPEFLYTHQQNVPWREFRQEDGAIEFFVNLLSSYLKLKDGQLFNEPKKTPSKRGNPKKAGVSKVGSSSITVVDSSDNEDVQNTPHKNRKRKVVTSQSAMKSRNAALAREERYREAMESQPIDSSQVAAIDASDPSKSDISINIDRDDELHDPIYIHPRMAKKMKAHQINGVCFMWREITAEDEEGGQGCLLAHTMGLGKTMQAIALLVALVEVSESRNPRIYSQLPAHLRPKGIRGKRQLRMLVLCPPMLLQNWKKEIAQWAPKTLGNVFSIEAGKTASHMNELESWHRVGGVLLMGYALFRGFVIRKTQKKQDDDQRLDEILLRGPEIVIADEAHNLKNTSRGVSKAASQIATKTRIALTGTPMSNDVDEIYSAVNWVAEGYLGEPAEFRGVFSEPIKEGLWEDSTRTERRRSMKKLQVLQHQIGPKVNRADITALKGSLKPKVEFVVHVPLTSVQTTLYKRYVEALLGGGRNQKATRFAIFSWLGVLMLLTNHPAAFKRKLLTPVPPKKNKKIDIEPRDVTPAVSDSGSNATAVIGALEDTTAEEELAADAGDPGEADLFALGFTAEMVEDILRDIECDSAPVHSAKMSILMDILDNSAACGDKVLIFSGSIPTIEYVNELLDKEGIAFGCITGPVTMARRMQLLEDLKMGRLDVMVISTRAGGTGLNIQSANRVVLLDFGFNPAHEEQAIGRAYRFGQQKPVYVYRMMAAGTFETNIYDKQLFKTSLSQRVVDKRNPRRNVQRNTREYLYEPRPVKQTDLSEEMGKDPDVLDKLLEKQAGGEDMQIRFIQTMEVLQADAQDEPLDEEERREVQAEIDMGKTMRGKMRGGPSIGLMTSTAPVVRNPGLPAAAHFTPPTVPTSHRPSTQMTHQHPAPGQNGVNAAPPATAPTHAQKARPSAGFIPLPPGK